MTADLSSGRFLLATPELKGSYFEDKIILLLRYDQQEGAYGVVVNHLSHIPLNEVFSGIPRQEWRPYPFYLGGPVEESRIQILQVEGPGNKATPLPSEGLPPQQKQEMDMGYLLQTIQNPATRVFLGYSGWSVGQLEREVEQNAWEIYSADPMRVLERGQGLAGLAPEAFKQSF